MHSSGIRGVCVLDVRFPFRKQTLTLRCGLLKATLLYTLTFLFRANEEAGVTVRFHFLLVSLPAAKRYGGHEKGKVRLFLLTYRGRGLVG